MTDEGYNLLVEAANPNESVIGIYDNHFFFIKKDENLNFIVEKNTKNFGIVTITSSNLFDAMTKIINDYIS